MLFDQPIAFAGSLLEAGAAVTVVDPDPAPALLAMASAWPALRVVALPSWFSHHCSAKPGGGRRLPLGHIGQRQA